MNKQGAKWCRRSTRLAVYDRDGYQCVYCGCACGPAAAQLDHVLARENGGGNESSNLVTCCEDCNRSKGVKPLEHWGRVDEIERVKVQTAKPLDIHRAVALALLRWMTWAEIRERGVKISEQSAHRD